MSQAANPTLWRCVAVSLAALAGLVSALFGDSEAAFVAVITVTSALGLLGMLACVTKGEGSSLWEIYAFVLCIGYGLGTLETFVGAYFLGFDPLARAATTLDALSWAITLVLFLVCALLMLSVFNRGHLRGNSDIPASQHPFVGSLFLVVTVVAVAMVAAGRIRYHGDVSADADVGVRLSATASLVSELICPIGAVALLCARRASPGMRSVFLLLIAIDLLVLATQGRRVFVFSILTFVLAFAAGGTRLKLLSIRSTVAALLLLIMVAAGSRFFYAMRIAQYEDAKLRNIAPLVLRAGEIFVDPKDDRLDAQLKENLAERAFILDYLAELLPRVDHAGPLKGDVFFNAFVTAVPELFFPWKYRYMYGMEEDLVHPRLGLPVWDAPNTTLTAGVSDFGLAGLCLYPILAVAACQIVLRIARYGGAVVHAAVYFALVNMLLNVENQLVGITAGLRDTVLIGIVVFVASWLFERLRSTGLLSFRFA